MNIIRICPDFFYKKENRYKGLSISLVNIINELKRLGVYTEIITLRSDITNVGGNKIYLLQERRPFSVIRTGIDSYKLLKKLNFDIIHTHQYSFFFLYHYKSKFNVPLVHEIHGDPLSREKKISNFQKPNYRDELYNYHFNRYASKRANAVIVKSNEISKEIIYRFGISPDKVHVIPSGVDTTFFIKKSIKKDIDILFVGRFVPLKSLLILLKTILILKKKIS